MSHLDLLVVGDINPDLILTGDDIVPEFGQVEKLIDGADLVVGGSAAITAIGAARLGAKVGICGVVGDDTFGRFMVHRLQKAGVETAAVRIDPDVSTGLSVIFATGGDRAILTLPGTIPTLGPPDLEALPDMPSRHVHAASYYLMAEAFRSALPGAMARFRASGSTTSLDTNWDPDERWDLDEILGTIDYFFPNEAELRAISGADNLTEGLEIVGGHGPVVAVKRGSAGAAALRDGGLVSTPAFSAGGYVDAVGAGDSFNAAFLVSMLRDEDLATSLRIGAAAGSLSTTGRGGTAGQPTMAELQQLLQEMP